MPLEKKAGTYIYYSPATDITGKKLAEALVADHGSTAPDKVYDVVICWGAKTSKPTKVQGVKVVNHPDAIRDNRNKLAALSLMKDAGVSVAPFLPAGAINNIGTDVKLPLIARKSFHQGGKGFWDCPTMTLVRNAISDGADYVQNLIEIVDEYRIHVFGDKILHSVKKTKRTTEETAEVFVTQELAKHKSMAEKNGQSFDEETARSLLSRQSKMFAQNGANMLVRSNRLGWKFSRVKSLRKDIADEAIKAVKAVGLDFGAVDCCVDVNGKVFILEVNSGPGLEETTFDVWVKELKAIGNDKTTAEATTDKKVPAKSTTMPSDKKSALMARLQFARDMVEVADDSEAAVLDSVFKKMFG